MIVSFQNGESVFLGLEVGVRVIRIVEVIKTGSPTTVVEEMNSVFRFQFLLVVSRDSSFAWNRQKHLAPVASVLALTISDRRDIPNSGERLHRGEVRLSSSVVSN